MKGFKGVTFDLWDTLIQEVPRKNPSLGEHRIDSMREALSSLGFDFGRDRMVLAYKKSGDFCDGLWNESRDVPVEAHLDFMLESLDETLVKRLNENGGYAKVRKVYEEAILDKPPVLFEEAAETLAYLKGEGYLVGLISNTGRTPGSVLRRILEDMKVSDYFDSMVFSNEVLIRKPRKEIFHQAMRGLSLGRGDLLHVGDDLERDYLGAIGSGMKAVLIDRMSEKDLQNSRISLLSDLREIL